MLELLERRRLSPIELRILLALRDGDVAVSGLAESFDRRPEEIRRAAARLYARGLLHWRHDRGRDEPTFAITQAGTIALRPIQIAGSPAAPGAPSAAAPSAAGRPRFVAPARPSCDHRGGPIEKQIMAAECPRVAVRLAVSAAETSP